ncbi:hypothetical protein OA007_00400 [SAR116 cluster bacterium]|nr:hypothetical protein [SAR116 cluster bacterium]
MTKHNLFSNVLATNGLARGYGPRPHKRKRKGLWLAFFVLLLALAGAVYVYQTDHMAELQTSIDQLTTPDEDVGKYGLRSEYMIDEDE